MDVLGVLKSVLGSIQFVTNIIKEDAKLSQELKNDLDFIKLELQMIQVHIEKHEDEGLQLQELAYDIEDFIYGLWVPGASGPILTAIGLDPRPQDLRRIDHFKRLMILTIEDFICGLWEPGAYGPILTAIGLDSREDYISSINNFKDRIKRLQEWQPSDSSQSGGCTARSGPSGSGSPPYTPEAELVGIAEPKRELLELLSESHGWQPQLLRVISIVGCRGLGKTALARAVYDHLVVADEFPCHAWVVASECSHAGDLLYKILKQVQRTARPTAASGSTSDLKHLQTRLHNFLRGKRYLIFIDDLQREVWEHIKDAFPTNNNSSRIIVTTCVHSVANACSSGSYVYTMQCLGEAESKDLFWAKVCSRRRYPSPAPSLLHGSKSIFIKCDGLPLALLGAANYLGWKGQDLTKACCEEVGEELGNYLSGNESAFGELKRALVQCYDSLPDYGHKTCLLSLSIFPRGHLINSKSLIRRLLAEGLIDGDDRKCFKELIDRSIIERRLILNNSKVVERCQVHNIMLEFTIRKSVSRNFVTLIHKDKLQRNKQSRTVRRLTVQSSTKTGCDQVVNDLPADDKGLSAIRSLTIFSSDLLNFKKCKLLRVLDLEGCRGLDGRILDDICDFHFLKYLSLRGTDVGSLPTKIQKLQLLETLDIRETRVQILPKQVIMLPLLAHLFGRFELPPHLPLEFLLQKSKLHTLAGFVINNKQNFENIILYARNLRKVKVWFNDTPAPSSTHAPAPASAPSSTHAPAPASAPSSTHAPAPAPSSERSLKRMFRVPYDRVRACLRFGTKPLRSPNPNPLVPPQTQEFRTDVADIPTVPPSQDLDRNREPLPIRESDFSRELTNRLTVTLVSSLKKRFTDLDSLSIDSSDLCKAFLRSLKAPCKISSIKLRGELESLPDDTTLGELRNLTKLHLFSTGLSSEALSVLQRLPCLEYLKLAEDRHEFGEGCFVVDRDGFPSLQRLCFEAPKLPRVQIVQGAMCPLTSLQLLSPESSFQVGANGETERRLGVAGITHLANLNEVILHYSATDADMQAWKEAANGHENRPYMKRHPEPISNTA